MRMHSIGKCSPNIIVGALIIFSIIVLYNYWNISTFNHDLTLKVHSFEQQVVSMSRINDALQSNWDKANQDKSRLEMSMKQIEIDCETSKTNFAEAESAKKRLINDLETMRRESLREREDYAKLKVKAQSTETEIGKLKDKIVSLEAQVVEKKNTIQRLEKQISENTQHESKNLQKSSTVSTAKSNNPPVQFQAEEPVLMNDPAVPYPNGWMDPKWSSHLVDVHGDIKAVGEKGIKNFGQVILFDDPKTPRKKPRFSVVDPPKNLHGHLVESQMNPQMNNIAKPIGIQSPLKQENFPIPETGGEIGRGAQGPNPLGNDHNEQQEIHGGVLPLPAKQPQQENLDAQEDDKDRNLKDEMALADDQSPDGELGFNNNNVPQGEGVVPPPNAQKLNQPMVYQKVNANNNEIVPNGGGGQSGQDFREAAHVNE